MYDFYLIPECNADTEFVEGISYEFNRLARHASGNDAVAFKLINSQDNFKAKIGFIDKDKNNNPKHFDAFILKEQSNSVEFKYLNGTNQYLFILNPAIDKFIWDEMHSVGLTPTEFELPDNFDEFKKILKKSSIENHTGYKRLIKKLKNQNSQGVVFILNKIKSILNTESA